MLTRSEVEEQGGRERGMRPALHVLSCAVVWLCASPAVPSPKQAASFAAPPSRASSRRERVASSNARMNNSSGDSPQFHLRGHTRNKLIHPMFLCTNPAQQEVAKQTTKCKDTVFPNATWPAEESWGGGNLLRCTGVVPVPECIAKGVVCLNGEVEIPPAPCHFPFEYKGEIYTQCVQQSGDPEPWCFESPNFKTPCSFAATMAGCVNDAITMEAYDEDKLKRKCQCEQKGYWNAPPSGGTVLSIIGAGFGSWEKPCDDAYMECLADVIKSNDNEKLAMIDEVCIEQVYGAASSYLPENSNDKPQDDAFPQNCRFHQIKIGHTTATHSWKSDTSITMIVPPGIGDGLTLEVLVGRYQYSQNDHRSGMLDELFSYDKPMEASVARPNSAALGTGLVLTVFGRHFGFSQHCVNVRIGSTDCLASIWSSDTSLRCVVPSGTGGALQAKVELMQCPPGLDIGPPLPDPYECRTTSDVGLSKAFSYDAPILSMIKPPSAPPAGFNLITLFGKNFGPFLDKAWQVEVVDQTTLGDEAGPTMIPVSNGIQAYSLAKYPSSSYYKGLHLQVSNKERAASFAAGLEFVCVSDSLDQYDGRPCLCIGPECNHPACGPIRVRLFGIVLICLIVLLIRR